MRVTFLIGNGFDLGLGMNTRFQDMYEKYLKISSKSPAISRFKETLVKDAPKYETWSDFEMGMAEYALTCENDREVIECVRDFKEHMVHHLRREEEDMLKRLSEMDDHESICADVVNNSLDKFYQAQSRNTIRAIENQKRITGVGYDVITFNYTKVFDEIYGWYFKQYYGAEREAIHVHGLLDEDVVLGIDNEDQIADVPYDISNSLRRAFIKPYFNEQYDQDRVNRASNLILSSNVICVYGMSLGKSDLMWTNLLVDWLHQDKRNMLFYFQYGEESYRSWDRDLIMDVEDEKKEALLRRITDSGEEVQALFDQVHIPVGYDIFKFDNLK